FDTVVSGSSVDTAYVDGFVQGAANHTEPSLPQVVVLFTAGSQSRNSTNYGVDQYIHFFMVGTVAPRQPGSSQNGGVNPNPLNYTLTPTVFGKLPNGIPFSALNVNYANNENLVHNIITNDEIALHTYVAANS